MTWGVNRRRRTSPGELRPAQVSIRYLQEPLLEFSGGRHHVDPKTGISRFGPKSFGAQGRHPASIRVGIIGSAETIDQSTTWISANAEGVSGEPERPEFPGFRRDRGFFADLEFSERWNALLSASELGELMENRKSRSRFENAVALLEDKLSVLARKDLTPDYVVLALPSEVQAECRAIEYTDVELGRVRRDLRRAFKAAAMRHRLPTQLLDESTALGKSKDYPSEIAWDFFTALYYKAGGFPWGPTGLASGTCYIGISFYRQLGASDPRVQTSLVQAFDEHGDGLILRGQDFVWDSEREGTRAPHMSEEQAAWTVQFTLRRYQEEMGQLPRRVVIHKTSRFWAAERAGFIGVLKSNVSSYDLLALASDTGFRLFPLNKYPPLRGTHYSVGELDFLYTTGFEAELQQFHNNHVPTPLRVADHIGLDTPRAALMAELLALSKMNWNSSRMGGLLPITINFAKRVGDVMREVAPSQDPLTNFKYYM